MDNTEELSAFINQVIINLNSKHPFYGRVLIALWWEFSEEVPYAATDFKRIFLNPNFVQQIKDIGSLRESILCLEFVLVHELQHVIKMHYHRRGERDSRLWNIACDYNINNELIKYDIGVKPSFHLFEIYEGKYGDALEEEIYEDLLKNPPPEDDSKPDFGGTLKPSSGEGNNAPMDKGVLQQKIDGIVAAAAKSARDVGKLPGYLEDWIFEQKQPQINWRQKLKQFTGAAFPRDVSWEKLNRRMINSGVYVPAVIKNGVGNMSVVVDTSGSVSNEELQKLFSELNALRSDCCPERTQVILFESNVYFNEVFKHGENLEINEIRRGGTNYSKAFDEIAGNPQCVIVLGDLEDKLNFPAPKCPVLWVSVTDTRAPWGETVFLD